MQCVNNPFTRRFPRPFSQPLDIAEIDRLEALAISQMHANADELDLPGQPVLLLLLLGSGHSGRSGCFFSTKLANGSVQWEERVV